MQERDVETIIQRAREKFPGVSPRIIADNGPQFIARDDRLGCDGYTFRGAYKTPLPLLFLTLYE
ncbi:MAG: hypothetical protein KAT34_15935 [Candidatus Aminicenantes bacterium]|nr:hypothetical protein [Candidatus Aminicenantes bacterium]